MTVPLSVHQLCAIAQYPNYGFLRPSLHASHLCWKSGCTPRACFEVLHLSATNPYGRVPDCLTTYHVFVCDVHATRWHALLFPTLSVVVEVSLVHGIRCQMNIILFGKYVLVTPNTFFFAIRGKRCSYSCQLLAVVYLRFQQAFFFSCVWFTVSFLVRVFSSLLFAAKYCGLARETFFLLFSGAKADSLDLAPHEWLLNDVEKRLLGSKVTTNRRPYGSLAARYWCACLPMYLICRLFVELLYMKCSARKLRFSFEVIWVVCRWNVLSSRNSLLSAQALVEKVGECVLSAPGNFLIQQRAQCCSAPVCTFRETEVGMT